MNCIQQARTKKNFTQEDLSDMLGIERSTVAKWETGKSNPRAEMLPKLANILGCTIDDLMRNDEGDHEKNAPRPIDRGVEESMD